MARILYRDQTPDSRKYAAIFLAFFWICGLLFGLILYFSAGDITASLMRSAFFSSVSIVNLLISCLLPFLFSAYAVYLEKPGLFALIIFWKACFLMFFSMGTLEAFGSGGWLVRALLMFSDICTTGVLYLYWSIHIFSGRKHSCRGLPGCILAVLLINGFDFYYIAPVLARITDYQKG